MIQGLRKRSENFFSKALYWIAYRVRIRLPRLSAALTLQFPLRPIPIDTPALSPAAQRIPPVVHQTWTSNRFGRTHRASLRRLQQANPEYEFHLSLDADIDEYMAEHWSHHPVYEVFLGARFGPLKTDVWRYCLLYDLGGIYLDISKAVAVPLSALVHPEDELMLSFDLRSTFNPEPDEQLWDQVLVPDRAVSNWLVAVVPRHALMLEVINSIADNYASYRDVSFKNPKDAILEFSGPRRLTHALHAVLRKNPQTAINQREPDFDGTAIWEIPGSWVRYASRPPYILASSRVIVG